MAYKLSIKANFYIRLSILIMVILFLIIDLISAIYFPQAKFQSLGYGERVANYYAFFTTESNYMVVIYFCLYLFDTHFRGRQPSFQTRLAVTVYITITMIVFWLGIFTAIQDAKQYSIANWISTIILHLIMPITMITSFIVTSGAYRINLKQQHHIYLWVIALYPAIYSIVILIRGHLRYLDYIRSLSEFPNYPPHPPQNTWYPYYFFDYSQKHGVIIAIAALVVIFGLVFGLQYFYLWINNLVFRRRQNPENRLSDFYQKVLKKSKKKQ